MNAHDSHVVIFVLLGLVAAQSLVIMWTRYVLVPRLLRRVAPSQHAAHGKVTRR